MMGAEIAVGYLCAYLVRKARRAGDAADAEVDRTVDAGMARVHDLVTRALGEDPALDQARSEAASEQAEVSEGTRRWVTHALTGAAQGTRRWRRPWRTPSRKCRPPPPLPPGRVR